MAGFAARLDRYFSLRSAGTSVRTELLAGLTTFLTMVYIVFVNPAILADAGIPARAAMTATCLAAGCGTLLMGLWARQPIALAPGMGVNAYFTYGVVQGLGVPWQAALGIVFLSGALFFVLALAGVRRQILEAIPRELYAAIAAGIGLFLALIGLRNAGVVAANEATLVGLGDLSQPATLVALAALIATAALIAWRVRAAVALGVLGAAAAGAVLGVFPSAPPAAAGGSADAFLALDLAAALDLNLLDIVFAFLFVDLFDTLGTVIAVTSRAGLMSPSGEIPRLRRMLTVDSASTMLGAAFGTSTVTCYIESAAGVEAGGRTGLTAVTVGVLFLFALPVAPLIGPLPAAATAPALILVGAMMMSMVRETDWEAPVVAIPSFLILALIPLTSSIATGLAAGFVTYDLLKILSGQGRQVSWMTHTLAALFILRFAYLAAS